MTPADPSPADRSPAAPAPSSPPAPQAPSSPPAPQAPSSTPATQAPPATQATPATPAAQATPATPATPEPPATQATPAAQATPATPAPPAPDGGGGSAGPDQDGGSAADGLLYPLDLAYARAGLDPPTVAPIAPDDIPLPYRALLVHDTDMTITLERHFGGRVVLRPLSTFTQDGSYVRRVLLVQEYAGQPVEMGAIRMELDAFDDALRRQILRNEIPLGRILRDGRFDYASRVRQFLAVTPNPEMMGVFWMREPRVLYGRRTEIIRRGAKIGDIVEVLPLVIR